MEEEEEEGKEEGRGGNANERGRDGCLRGTLRVRGGEEGPGL